mmetsp:Transcript_18206/g.26378  ORF Transcript_18206/g.26378 Transcript_18206/m.26378 type:complete len:131 (-) Transcript_18206:1126-1518(-)
MILKNLAFTTKRRHIGNAKHFAINVLTFSVQQQRQCSSLESGKLAPLEKIPGMGPVRPQCCHGSSRAFDQEGKWLEQDLSVNVPLDFPVLVIFDGSEFFQHRCGMVQLIYSFLVHASMLRLEVDIHFDIH